MRKKQKQSSRLLFGLLGLFLIGIAFVGCEAEKDFVQESETGRQMKRDITFEQFKNEIDQPKFNTRLSIAGSDLARTMEDFEIDTTQVKSLERAFIVYSMKLDPKFVPEEGKFYNLFVYKDNDDEIVKQIIEILPSTEITGETEQEIYNYFQTATKELIYSSKTMNSVAICISTGWVEVCNCMGHTRDQCGGCSLGFHWSATITYGNCGDGDGGSGEGEDYGSGSSDGSGIIADPVLPSPNKDNCDDLKAKSNTQDFNDKLNELKADASGTTGEKAFQTFAGTPKFSPKYSATPQEPSAVQMPFPTRTDCTGFMHCHMNDPALKNFAIFTPDDFITQRYLIENSTAPITSFTMYVTSQIQGVSSTFAIKITDIEMFNTMAGLMEAFPNVYKKIWTNKIKETNTPDIQINVFLNEMQKAGFEGFELYKSDENLENWEQQTLNNSGNTIKIKC